MPLKRASMFMFEEWNEHYSMLMQMAETDASTEFPSKLRLKQSVQKTETLIFVKLKITCCKDQSCEF